MHESGGYLFKTNSDGFRSDRNFLKNKNPGNSKKRILIFGDSYTAGDGVSNSQRYSDILESKLQNVEVYNFGLPGTGTDQQYLIWKKFAKEIECDAIVIGLQVENIRRIVATSREYLNLQGKTVLVPKPYFEFNNGELKLSNIPVPKEYVPSSKEYKSIINTIERGGNHLYLRNLIKKFGPKVKMLAQRVSRYQPLNQYEKNSNYSWLLMEAILNKWCSEVNVPVIIFTIPTYHYIEKLASSKAYQSRFRSFNKSGKVYVHDPLKDIHEFPPKELRKFRFENDDHPTPLAHEVFASSLAKTIKNIKGFQEN